MEELAKLARLKLVTLLAALAAIVIVKLLAGEINMRCLLDDKPTMSPRLERIQFLGVTFALVALVLTNVDEMCRAREIAFSSALPAYVLGDAGTCDTAGGARPGERAAR